MATPTENPDIETGNALTRMQSSLVHATRMSKAISDTARRMRFSTRVYRGSYAGGFLARRGQRTFRLGLLISFILLFVVPSIVVSLYLGFIASPQYMTEIRLTLGGGETMASGDGSAFRGVPVALIAQDTEIVEKFLRSPAIVNSLAKSGNLGELYQKSNIDWFSRLSSDASMEDLQRYWKSKTSADIQMPGGILVFKIKAFSPEDSAKLAAAALASSETMVNDLNERMVRDTLQRATTDLKISADHLSAARGRLEQTRNDEGMLNAGDAADAVNQLLTSVQAGRIALQQEYDSRRRFVAASQPEMRTLQSQIHAADLQIADLKSRLTVTAATNGNGKRNVVAAAMAKLSALELDRQIAEMQYSMASTALQEARITAESKLVYLNPFVMPMLGEKPGFPTPPEKIAFTVLIALAAWGGLAALATLVRNNMA